MSPNDTFDSSTIQSLTDIPSTAGAYEENNVVDTLDVYMIILGVVGVLDNGFAFVVAVFYSNIKQTLTGLLIIHQTFLDFVTSGFLLIQHSIYLSGRSGVMVGNTLLANVYCWLWQSETILWGTLLASTLNLVVVSIERYLAVVWPVFHKTHVSAKMIVPTAVLVWTLGMGFNICWSIKYSHIENDVCLGYDFDNNTVTLFYACISFGLYYALPLICFILCYGQMVFTIRFKKVQTKTHTKASKGLLRTLLLVTIAFVMCWTWSQFVWLFLSVGIHTSFAYDNLYYANLATMIGIVINPIIYMAQYRQFQRGMKTMFRRMKVYPAQTTQSSTIASASRSRY